jgi:hypothetical protein
VTATESSEYTPKTSPDNLMITFIRDGGVNPDQTVWKLDRESGEYSSAINSTEPVGDYHLNHENGDVLFWSRYGFSVHYLNLKRDLDRFVIGNAVPGCLPLEPVILDCDRNRSGSPDTVDFSSMGSPARSLVTTPRAGMIPTSRKQSP